MKKVETVKNVTNFYAVSASVGSGKTHAAIQYMLHGALRGENFIYVAPTKLLLEQTAENLSQMGGTQCQGLLLNIHVIHSESKEEDAPTWVEAIRAIEEASQTSGLIIMLTTTTFLNIVYRVQRKHLWRVILDESFQPVSFYQYHLGTDLESGWTYFEEVFSIHPDKDYLITPAPGCHRKVSEVAVGNYQLSGDRARGQQGLAALVANPARRCVVVKTKKSKALLDARYGPTSETPLDAPKEDEEGGGPVLLVASCFTPEEFIGYKEVIFMADLFDRTILYYLWRKQFGICFHPHTYFESSPLRDTHREQGKYISIGHLLHEDDTTSKMNLSRNAHTGEPNDEELGCRVIDVAVKAAGEYFNGQPFLLQVNDGYGYEKSNLPLLPPKAIKIPTLSHGLNSYQETHNVVALAVTNPNRQEAKWLMDMTGLSYVETLIAHRIHTTYQAVGRSSIRSRSNGTDRKTFLVVGYEDAKFLHDLFPGSRWLGQVGSLPSLSLLQLKGEQEGKIVQTARAICRHLESMPVEIRRIASRALKQVIAPSMPPRSWAKATRSAGDQIAGWVREGSSFVRRSFETLFGGLEVTQGA